MRATKIAEVLQDNMSRLQNRYGGIGSSRFIRYIDNITMENVWVVDENKNVKMHREDAGALPEQHGMMHGHKRMLMRQQEDIAEPASDFDYNALSPEIKERWNRALPDRTLSWRRLIPYWASWWSR